MASVIDFTRQVCKNEDSLNRQLIDNLDQHLAMFSFSNIGHLSNVQAVDNVYIIAKTKNNTYDEIINKLSSYRCSYFDKTLVPVFTIVEEGLKIELKVDGE